MRTRRSRSDDGFTLVEVLTALAVIGVVAAATTTFFIRSMITINQQGARQAAIQVATDAMEQLRAVPGPRALDFIKAHTQASKERRNGLEYTLTWSCVDAGSVDERQANPQKPLTGCTSASVVLQPSVTVTFQGNGCPTGGCTYTTHTRISTLSVDPIFGTQT